MSFMEERAEGKRRAEWTETGKETAEKQTGWGQLSLETSNSGENSWRTEE
jgi:hypothetical protein